MRALLVLALLTHVAHADEPDPCRDAVLDPVVTPVRDRLLDAQRGACMRDEMSAGILGHALVDTPGFRGVLGGDFLLGGRLVIAKAHELSAQLRVVDYTFVQNAVNKVTHTGFGPVVLGAAAGGRLGRGARGTLALRVELPYTHDNMDTLHLGGQLVGAVTAQMSPRTVMHARLGAIGLVASSSGGTTQRLAFATGSDIAFHVRRSVAVFLGGEVMAGWDSRLDHFLLRPGVHVQVRDALRVRIGAAVPVAGSERTNAIVDLSLLVDR